MLYLKLAWRNTWRNRKRSLISMGSVLFAVVLALGMRSMQIGFYDKAIDNVVSYYTGYLQVHAPEYTEQRSLDHSFSASDSLRRALQELEGVTVVAPRLEVAALISGGDVTDGGLVVGIDPSLETQLTGLREKVVAGRYLTADEPGLLLAEGLADHLGLELGEDAVILGQGYHGMTAVGKYTIVGLVRFPTPELNTRLAYLGLTEAQRMSGAEDRLTSLAIMLTSPDALEEAQTSVARLCGERLEVESWREMMPELVQFIQTDNASGIIMLIIVYVVIGFGIVGTVLMMTLERVREFGMLVAIGMHRGMLRTVVVLEGLMLTFLGTIGGVAVALPIILYFHAHPIYMTGQVAEMTRRFGFEPVMPFALDPGIFVSQALTVFVIALLASMYPLIKITTLQPAAAIREG